MLSALNEKLEKKYVVELKANPGCSCSIRSFPVKEIPSEIDFEKSNILGIYPDEKYGYICFMYEIKPNGSIIAWQESKQYQS